MLHRNVIRLVQVGTLALFFTSTAAFAVFGTGSTNAISNILSPSDFANKVSTLKKQTKESVAEEAKSLITSKPMSPATGPAPATSETAMSQPQNSAPANQPAAQPAGTNQTYTGFGNAPANAAPSAPSAPSSTSNSGGWNIKY